MTEFIVLFLGGRIKTWLETVSTAWVFATSGIADEGWRDRKRSMKRQQRTRRVKRHLTRRFKFTSLCRD
jgi:hypothetical protein